MKSKKSKVFGNLKTPKFSSEPKAMKELHKIREKMSKLSVKELLKELEETRKKFNGIIAANETKSKKIELRV